MDPAPKHRFGHRRVTTDALGDTGYFDAVGAAECYDAAGSMLDLGEVDGDIWPRHAYAASSAARNACTR